MSLKKVFSTIAAAAIAVGGLAIGASAASADEATFGTAITLTASDKSQLEGHTFSAIRLADYASDTDGYVSVTTVKDNESVYNKIVAAATASNGDEALPEGIDPVAYISGASTMGALTDDDQNAGQDNSTSSKPWTGSVRTFVNDLTNDDTLKNAATAVTLGEITESDENGYSATLNMETAGLYLIFDTTDAEETAKGQDVNAIPMLVGTDIMGASNRFVDENGDETAQWPATYMGTVAVKNQTTTVSKTVNGEEQISASIGDTVHYQFSAPLPTTTGFSASNPYTFKLTDTPGVGQEIDMYTGNTNSYGNSTFTVFIDMNENGQFDDGDVRLPRVSTNDTTGKGFTFTDGNGTGLANYEGAHFTGNNTSQFVIDLAKFVSSDDYQTSDYAGKNVVVKYNATITANAQNGKVPNKVEVNSQNAKAEDSTKITYGGFSFTKTDAAGNDLTGAKFAIKNSDNKYLKWENGVWTQAPTGYLSSAKVTFKVTIKNGKAVHFDETDLVNGNNDKGSADGTDEITGYKVKNYKSISQLPLTGGAGIALFTIVGLLLVGAGVTVHMKNRNGNRAALV